MVTSKWLVETRKNNKNKKLETIVEVVTLAGNLSLINQDLIVQIFFFFIFFYTLNLYAPTPAKKRNKFSDALLVLQSNTKEFPNFPLLESKAKMSAQIIPKIFTEMHLLFVLKEMHSLLFNLLSSRFFFWLLLK